MGKLLLVSVFYLVAFVFIYPKVHIKYCITEEFEQYGLVWKLFYINASMIFVSFKYYFSWTLCDAGSTASGLSYNGKKNGKDCWNRVICANPMTALTTLSVAEKMNNWNMPVQVWLKNYVYLRFFSPKEFKESKKK